MKDVRVRFAPAPTGLMHLGNVRAALINYLFARQKNGSFILRIEDTDPQRNFDPGAIKIMEDLAWLGLSYDEGPPALEPYGPYFQSQRTELYQEKLELLKEKKFVYPCFCTPEELEKKRKRQIALKQPPRYDRTCLGLTREELQKNLDEQKPFVWRFKIDHNLTVSISDLARGDITFDLKNYSDFPLTRTNGTFTFIFCNVVDDITMRISHVFRGEDHLSNTASQAAIYLAFQEDLPTFWHMPILCNIEGKKLSKRDFGFSLKDLKDAGYLPEAILNYLGIIGGSFQHEIMPLEELVSAIDFDHLQPTGQIRYDVQKLNWVNHQWMLRLQPEQLLLKCKPYILEEFPPAPELSDERLIELLKPIQGELTTLADVKTHLAFYFHPPLDACRMIQEHLGTEETSKITKLLEVTKLERENGERYLEVLRQQAKKAEIKSKSLFTFLRIALTGSTSGPSIAEIIDLLGMQETQDRLTSAAQTC